MATVFLRLWISLRRSKKAKQEKQQKPAWLFFTSGRTARFFLPGPLPRQGPPQGGLWPPSKGRPPAESPWPPAGFSLPPRKGEALDRERRCYKPTWLITPSPPSGKISFRCSSGNSGSSPSFSLG